MTSSDLVCKRARACACVCVREIIIKIISSWSFCISLSFASFYSIPVLLVVVDVVAVVPFCFSTLPLDELQTISRIWLNEAYSTF